MLLRKSVYPCGYVDEWEELTERPLSEEFYSNLNMEDITDADYMYTKGVCQDFEIKNLGEYQDFYLKSDKLLLTNGFENILKMRIVFYLLDPAKWLSAPG